MLDNLDPSESHAAAPEQIWAHGPHPKTHGYDTMADYRNSHEVLKTAMLVQRECGVKDPIRVAPLFETLDDLDHSESAMEQLLSNEWYSAHIKGEQECMIGYSDSGKDAGRMAAAWGLYKVQVR